MANAEAGGPNTTEDGDLIFDGEMIEALQEAVQEVFSTMVFSACDRAEIDQSGLDPTVHVPGLHVHREDGTKEYSVFEIDAEVGFVGAFEGHVLLRCSAQGAMDIARGLLMLDEGDAIDVAEAADALGECANMVTGVVKTRMLDPRGHFDLSCPKINGAPPKAGQQRAGTLAYELTHGVIAVEIWLEKKA